MFVNIIKSYRYVVAICDSELLGKYFEEGNFQLEVKENFYKGKEGSESSDEEVSKIMNDFKREDATFNIVGRKAVDLALKEGIIEKDSVGEIQGVPFALVLL